MTLNVKHEHSKIDPVMKESWIAALRSGKYKQGKGALQNNGCFCCLGVLSEIMDVPKEEVCTGYYEFAFFDGAGKLFHNRSVPPGGAFGLDGETITELWIMNDNSDQKSFAQIADWIDANL